MRFGVNRTAARNPTRARTMAIQIIENAPVHSPARGASWLRGKIYPPEAGARAFDPEVEQLVAIGEGGQADAGCSIHGLPLAGLPRLGRDRPAAHPAVAQFA